jgi:Spy/CpxP family protein refolding chaperone
MKNNMKKIIILSLILLCSIVTQAQERDEHREKIKALKTAHLTEGLNLTTKEAQQFWPVYNDFQNKRRELYRKERADVENLECMTESDANSKLNEYVELEKEDFLLKKQYFKDLSKIFSAKKILHLKQLEEEFNRKLIQEYRARRENSQK